MRRKYADIADIAIPLWLLALGIWFAFSDDALNAWFGGWIAAFATVQLIDKLLDWRYGRSGARQDKRSTTGENDSQREHERI